MRFFIFMILQVLFFLPMTSLATDGGMTPAAIEQNKTEITEAQRAVVNNAYGNLPLYFIENKGQVDGQVSFYERGAGHATFFTSDGVVLSLTRREGKVEKPSYHGDIKDIKPQKDEKVTTEAVTLSFVGANDKAKITASNPMPGHVNYFVGNDKTKWRSNIPTYKAVTYNDVYKNIDIKFYGNNKNIEHDVIVRPGGDPSLVQFAYEGVKGLKVTEGGDLEVSLEHGKLIETRPAIYQMILGERVAVDGSYRLLKGEDGSFNYGFTVASYDHTKDLVIDPLLDYSTYLGGSAGDFGQSIAVDSSGAAYVTGTTGSIDFPLMNPIQGASGGGTVAFVTKINPAGTAIIYSTYLGGSVDDQGLGIAVDSSGAAYVTGKAWSGDFPLMNPIQGALGGASDAFITKINPTGTAITYSTFLGGIDLDWSTGIAVDSSGAAYVTGKTWSGDFPLINPIQGASGGGIDAFITKINPTGTAIIYSTYLGGSSPDEGFGIAVDSLGAAYVTGDTNSGDFPLMNPIQGALGGRGDAFITKITPTGTAIIYSTFLGGNATDQGLGIAVDSSGAAYVTGLTRSGDFPLSSPIQGAYGGGFSDAFMTKINPTGTAITYSTFLGGIDLDWSTGIAVDSSGVAYVTGWTLSGDFPLRSPIQGVLGGASDAFITKINPTGTAILYSTYLGGSGDDQGNGIAVDSSGAAYVTGWTDGDFPLMNPVQGVRGGGADAFITKISAPVVDLAITPVATSVPAGSILAYAVTVTNTTVTRQCFNYWENVTLPNSSTYPPTGELFGPVHLCLNAGASKTVHLSHGVPLTAPIGAYIFNAFTGAYPIIVVSEDHFNLDVTAFNPAMENPQTSWRLLENGFRQ